MRAGGMNVEGVIEEFRSIQEEEREHPFLFSSKPLTKLKLRAEVPVDPGHFEIAAAAWSDWHISERVRSEDANGINAYNSLIAANRVAELVSKTKKIIQLHNSMYPIKKLWLSLLGDMINGSIQEDSRANNDLSDPAAAILTARLIILGLTDLKALGIPIQVDSIVGNHPRQTFKVPTKAQAQTSYDWLVYEMVATHFAADQQVTVNVHTGQMARIKILDWTYVIEHGIGWSNGNEEDFESRIRDLFDDPIYREATGLQGTSFDQIIIGDKHKPAFLERTIKNGSLIGQNELGQSWRLKPIRAQQLIWGISKSHVRTWQYQLDMTEIKDEKGSNPFLDYAKEFVGRHGRSF